MLWLNQSVSGATFTAQLSGSAACITDTEFGENPDYIVLQGGSNDADLIGNALLAKPERFGTFEWGDFSGEYDSTTFCGALESLFYRLVTDYETAKIGFVIVPKMGFLNSSVLDYTVENNNRRCYFETIIQLCNKWGISVLNLWDNCLMNPELHTQSEEPMYTDGQHLTAKGYDYISSIIENWLKTL